MTRWPQLIPIGRHLLPGVIAFFVFVIFTATFLLAEFPEAAGFPDTSIVAVIGYSLIGAAEYSQIPATENFLVALILIAIVLDAALDGSLMLAKRDEDGTGGGEGGERP